MNQLRCLHHSAYSNCRWWWWWCGPRYPGYWVQVPGPCSETVSIQQLLGTVRCSPLSCRGDADPCARDAVTRRTHSKQQRVSMDIRLKEAHFPLQMLNIKPDGVWAPRLILLFGPMQRMGSLTSLVSYLSHLICDNIDSKLRRSLTC